MQGTEKTEGKYQTPFQYFHLLGKGAPMPTVEEWDTVGLTCAE